MLRAVTALDYPMIERADVDGVSALLVPGSGPTRAGLAFRVGFVDEPLARRGITHLVEHLALYSAGVADFQYNGATGVEFTVFQMHGGEEDVAGFLGGVCSSLRDLPLHRLATEKDLLRAEASGRGGRVAEDLPMWRHGARDYGMPSYPEWGLSAITEDELRAWVARYFTKENAVLWVTGPGDRVAAGLKLDLPSGERWPLPTPSSALPETPAYFAGPGRMLVWDALVPRGAAAWVFADVLERALRRELRQERGLSYLVRTDYETLGAERAVVTAVADALPGKQGEVVGAFTEVLARMRAGRIRSADLAAVVKQRIEDLDEAGRRGATAPGQALNLLVGAPVRDVTDVIEEIRTVTVAGLAGIADAASAAGLLQTPGSPAKGYAPAPDSSGDGEAVGGTSYASLDDPDESLVIGPEGVSLVTAGSTASVRFDACSIVLAWPDGARHFVGHDALLVAVEPSLYAGAGEAMPWLDERIPPAVRVDQPARDPGNIPRPRTRTAPARAGATVALICLAGAAATGFAVYRRVRRFYR
jgi:hypothetical protein